MGCLLEGLRPRGNRLGVGFRFLVADALHGENGRLFDSFLVTKHRDRFPRAVFRTERTADTALNIDLDELLKLDVRDIRDNFNTIDRTKRNARFAARTPGLVNDRKKPGLALSRRLLRN